MADTRRQFQQLRLRLTLIFALIGFFVILCFNLAVLYIFNSTAQTFRNSFDQTDELATDITNIDSDKYLSDGSLNPNSQRTFILRPPNDGIESLSVTVAPDLSPFQAVITHRLQRFAQNFQNALLIFDLAVFVGIVILGYCYTDYVLRPVEQNFRRQEDFVLDASHELKTPIATILAEVEALELTQKGQLSEEVQETLTVVKEEARNLHYLSQSLLDLSKTDQQQPKLVLQNFSELVEQQAKKFQSRAAQKQQRLITRIEPEVWVMGDKYQLTKLLDILLDNAAKYAPTKGKITVTLQVIKKQVQLTIADNGTGINPRDSERIFDRFYRANNQTTWQNEGSGLGLSIARQIAHFHRAKLIATNVKPHGASFSFTLPQANYHY